ncbi:MULTISPECIES: CDP-alcohol phosphatidyltransferase family protein [unclassified Streptomyces]|uniref:CDP-alcohol phosphatidyltransferase family protein n=1 Tax=unclassified Streptomyces TaxID=2593676 RepID=UPI0033AE38BA
MTEFAEVLRQLSAAQKPAKGTSLYTRFVNRPAGRVLAALAYRVGATPNQLTVLAAVFTFPALAVVALLPPGPMMAVCVAASLAVGFALDAADGQLARGQRSGSPSGEWLDHVLDCAKIVTLHMAVLVSFYRFFALPSPALLLAPMLFQLAAVVIFFAGILTEKLKRLTPGEVPAGSPPALRSVLLLPVDYGLTCLSFLFLGSQDLFLPVYCTLLLAHVLFMAAFLVKWYRELS